VLTLVTAVAGWEAGRAGRTALARFLGAALVLMLALPLLAPGVSALAASLVEGAADAAVGGAAGSPAADGAAETWVGLASLAETFASFSSGRPVLLVALAALAGAWFLGRRAAAGATADRLRMRRLDRYTGWAYVLLVPAALLLLRGVGGLAPVSSSDWGGLLLTLILAAFAIALSFPLGVLLALGRRSSLPLVRLVCIGWIELIRGVPLVTVLYMASLLLPLVIPEGWNPDNVAKAIAGLTAFASAYVAEDVRGGLAAVDAGQYDAAKAVGLSTVGAYRLIILPQAIRAVIPAIAGQFISLFKDTALVLIISLRELLGIAIVAANQPAYVGRFRETLAFIAIIYFAFSAVLSRASRRLEAPLSERERD
jgi:general L-amino acid transport system permease protein